MTDQFITYECVVCDTFASVKCLLLHQLIQEGNDRRHLGCKTEVKDSGD